MSKKTFKTFRYEDLTGGINIKDYPSEIDDKQALSVLNWNFDGNKLVSGKGKDITINKGVGNIQGLVEDNGDIYHIQAGNIYKNGISLYLNNSYEITFNTVNGKVFSIEIDGVKKGYKFGTYGTEEEALTDLLSTLQTDFPTYTISRIGNIFTISNGGDTIEILNPNTQKRIQVSNWHSSSEITITIDGVDYEGDGGTYATNEDYIDYLIATIPSTTYFISATGPAGTLDLVRKDGEAMVITSSSTDKYQYVGTWLNREMLSGQVPDYFTNNIGGLVYKNEVNIGSNLLDGWRATDKMMTGSFSNVLNQSIGGSVLNTTSILGRTIQVKYPIKITSVSRLHSNVSRAVIIQGGSIIASASFVGGVATFDQILEVGQTYTIGADNNGATYETSNYNKNTINSTYYQTTDNFPDNGFQNVSTITGEVYFDELYSTSYNKSTAIPGQSTIIFNKSDYTQVTLGTQLLRLTNLTDLADYSYVTENNIKATITISNTYLVTYGWENTGLGISSDELFNMTISSYGILLVGYVLNSGAIFIDWDGVITELGVSAVGTPTVGTIYKGKIILGGYISTDGIPNDNIVFSRTGSPTDIASLILFTGGDAGGQAVSGGNKGTITGFLLGEDGLYVFKNNEVWKTNDEKVIYNPDNSIDFNFIFKKVTSTGALNQRCITEVGQETFYFDGINKCIRRLGYEANLTALRDANISKEVEQYFRDIPDYNNILINAGFKYPYYYININNTDSPYYDLTSVLSYRVPDVQMVYNVDNKAWAIRNEYDSVFNYTLMSHKGYVGTDGNYIYKDFELNTEKEGEFLSKLYTFGDDMMYKKYGSFDIIGRVIGTKTLTIEIYVGDEKVDEREYTFTNQDIREKIDLYDIGQNIQIKLKHSGTGKIEIYDIQFQAKMTTMHPNDYF